MRTFAIIAGICMLVMTKNVRIFADGGELELYSTAAVLMDGESGRILYGKGERVPLANASTTKILTCILLLEHCDLEEELSVSGYAASMPKVRLGMARGETYRMEDLLYSLMLESHNDAAVALAEHVGKRYLTELSKKEEKDFTKEESALAVKAFAALMNQKASQIGCEDTYFITPNGLDATEEITMCDGTLLTREHHVTAVDLARILSYAILRSTKREEFLRITRKTAHSFTANGRGYALNNHNAFLSMMDGALTGKTGFTGKAGYCYAGALYRDGRLFVVALLGCGWPNNRDYKWKDCKKLMEYGLANYQRKALSDSDVLADEKELPAIRVLEAQSKDLGCRAWLETEIPGRDTAAHPQGEITLEHLGEGEGILLRPGEEITHVVRLPSTLEAPVSKGDKVGEITYFLGQEVIWTEDVTAAEDVRKIDFVWCLKRICLEFLRLS